MRVSAAAWLAAMLAAVVSGCGGGGESDGPSTATFQIAAATEAIVKTGRRWSAVNESNGTKVTLQFEIAADASGRSFATTVVLVGPDGRTENGGTAVVGYATGPFTLTEFRQAGLYTQAGIQTAMPQTALTGTYGTLLQARLFEISPVLGAPPVDRGSYNAAWSLEANNRDSSFLCLTSQSIVGGLDSFSKYCFEIAPNGAALGGFQAVAGLGTPPNRQTLTFK